MKAVEDGRKALVVTVLKAGETVNFILWDAERVIYCVFRDTMNFI